MSNESETELQNRILDYAKKLHSYSKDEWLSVQEIVDNLSFIRTHSNDWYSMSVFIAQAFSHCNSNYFFIDTLMSATNYGRSQIYNFKKAGIKITHNKINKADVNGLSLSDFLDSNFKPKNEKITNISCIGKYLDTELDGEQTVFIYKGTYDKYRRVYFRSTQNINGDITVENKIPGSSYGNICYYYNNDRINLYHFEIHLTKKPTLNGAKKTVKTDFTI